MTKEQIEEYLTTPNSWMVHNHTFKTVEGLTFYKLRTEEPIGKVTVYSVVAATSEITEQDLRKGRFFFTLNGRNEFFEDVEVDPQHPYRNCQETLPVGPHGRDFNLTVRQLLSQLEK